MGVLGQDWIWLVPVCIVAGFVARRVRKVIIHSSLIRSICWYATMCKTDAVMLSMLMPMLHGRHPRLAVLRHQQIRP